MLHILDRRTMSVVHSEVYEGPLGVGEFTWHDANHLLITSSYKSALAEGRGSAGVFILDIRSKDIRRVWGGEGSSDYGGFEGGDLGASIDDEHYWLTVGPSGSTYSEFPYFYLYKLNVFTGRADRVLKSPSRVASFVFNKDNEVTHAIGMLPDDFDSTVVHRRVNGEWVLEGIYRNPEGARVPVRWHKWDPDKILYRDNTDAQTIGYYWVDAKTGAQRTDLSRSAGRRRRGRLRRRRRGDRRQGPVRLPDLRAVAAGPSAGRAAPAAGGRLPGTRSRSSRRPRTASSTCCACTATANRGSSISGTSTTARSGTCSSRGRRSRPKIPADPGSALQGPRRHGTRRLPDGAEAQAGAEAAADRAAARWSAWRPRQLGLRHGGRAFANAGYAVLKVNYRGSGGYGKDFHYKWYRHWGLEMQDDLEDGVLWAAGAGIADIDRVCIYGASYGGYAALMGVVKTPDRYQCAIGYVGVYDLNTMRKVGDVSRSRAGRSTWTRRSAPIPRTWPPARARRTWTGSRRRVPRARHAGRPRALPALRGNARGAQGDRTTASRRCSCRAPVTARATSRACAKSAAA